MDMYHSLRRAMFLRRRAIFLRSFHVKMRGATLPAIGRRSHRRRIAAAISYGLGLLTLLAGVLTTTPSQASQPVYTPSTSFCDQPRLRPLDGAHTGDELQSQPQVGLVYDVVVYGGTSAGVIAAVQVQQMGHTVVLIAPETHLGGLSSSGLGATDSGNRSVIGGLSRDFYHRLWKHYQNETAWVHQPMPIANGIPGQGGRGIDNETQTMWVFEPSVAEAIFEDYLRENEIPVYRNERLDRQHGVTKEGATIVSIATLSGKTFYGKRFLDATYEGDLLAAAGVTYTVGRESNAQYGETLNGRQIGNAVYHQFAGPVDPYVEPGNPASGLLPMVLPPLEGNDGDADSKIQAYCFRMCLTNVPENRVPFEKPDDYDERNYELLFRSIDAGQKDFCTFSPMPNHKTDSNNNFAVSTDFIGQNWNWPEGSYEERERIYQAHLTWQRGLMWTLRNHPRTPEPIRNVFEPWGLSQDEFADNGYWPYTLYIREGRRMVGDFVVSERHLRRMDPTPRPVGMGSYNMDSHHIQRYVAIDANGAATVRNEGDVQVNPGGPYPIDYGALLPKSEDCDNLLVPVCVSCTHIAYGSIRMEPVFMLLGQSAATAAILSLETGVTPQELPYETLRARLVADGQILEWTPPPPPMDLDPTKLGDVVQDDTQAERIGTWIPATAIHPYVGTGYLHDADEQKGQKSVRYRLVVPESANYDVWLSYTAHPNRATNVPVTVRWKNDAQSKKITVNQRETPPREGTLIRLCDVPGLQKGDEITVTIETTGTNGFVIADAVCAMKNP